jgi:GNAT superfamily N-acetyltransferase
MAPTWTCWYLRMLPVAMPSWPPRYTTTSAEPMLIARLIPLEATYPLRLLVLRPGGALADCHFESDLVDGGFHVGTFTGDACIAVGSFSPEAHPELPAERPYRLRGMATHPDHQGTGAGKSLMRTAFPRSRNAVAIGCGAMLGRSRCHSISGWGFGSTVHRSRSPASAPTM